MSSTGVYGDAKKNDPYIEYDKVIPTTVHHKSKYAAEIIVRHSLQNHLILRTGWLFGGHCTHSKNFVYKRFLEAKEKEYIYSNTSQVGNPTSIEDLSRQIEMLIKHQKTGIYNCVNKAKDVSRFDYVKKIVELCDIKCEIIKKDDLFERLAPVSDNESAINYKLDEIGENVMGDWDVSLKKYIEKELLEWNKI
jgi:dTDP-4-dehydrorhamnose reductase